MTTVNPRLNITIPQEIVSFLEKKAHMKKTSLSKIALDLIIDAMERDEDLYYSKIAEERESKNKKWCSHDEVWG